MKEITHVRLGKAALVLGWFAICSAILCSAAMAQAVRAYTADLRNGTMVPPVEREGSFLLVAVSNESDRKRPCPDGGETVTFTERGGLPFDEILWLKLYRGAPGEIGEPYGVLYERGKTEWVQTLEIPAEDCVDWATGGKIYAVVATRDYPAGAARGTFRIDPSNPVEEESWGYIKSRYRESAVH